MIALLSGLAPTTRRASAAIATGTLVLCAAASTPAGAAGCCCGRGGDVDGRGGTATGAATIGIIANAAGRALALDLASAPGQATVSFTGVPWYSYECQRATNVNFAGTLHVWPVQAGPDGALAVWDDFNDLGAPPPEAYYRLHFLP